MQEINNDGSLKRVQYPATHENQRRSEREDLSKSKQGTEKKKWKGSNDNCHIMCVEKRRAVNTPK